MDIKHISPKERVVVKRMWHSPEIHAYIDNESVGARMDVSDFTRALVEEVFAEKSRFLMLSKADALAKILEATDTILSEMKSTTTHVV